MNKIFLLLLSISVFSCTIDYKSKGYWAENCTSDTLIMEMNECNTISDGSDWIYNSPDSTLSSFDDTISGNILGKKLYSINFIMWSLSLNQELCSKTLIRAIYM